MIKKVFLLTANSTLKKIKRHLRHPLIFPIFSFWKVALGDEGVEPCACNRACLMLCSCACCDKVAAEWTWARLNTELRHTELICSQTLDQPQTPRDTQTKCNLCRALVSVPSYFRDLSEQNLLHNERSESQKFQTLCWQEVYKLLQKIRLQIYLYI